MGHGRVGDQTPPAQQTLWEVLEPAYRWQDLILPRRQRELLRDLPAELRDLAASRVGYGHREARPQKLTLLFTGPTGTGKTMAAQILGAALEVPVVRLELADAVARDPDEGVELADRLFSAVEDSGAVVIFDAPAALLEDQGAKLAAVLGRSYRYPGIAIFAVATTEATELGLAWRFDFVIEFPLPDRSAREQIWSNLLPRDARVTEAQLSAAASAELSGAMILSCCQAAAAYAAEDGVPIQDRHVARALESIDYLEPARPVSVALPAPPERVEEQPAPREEEARPREEEARPTKEAPPEPPEAVEALPEVPEDLEVAEEPILEPPPPPRAEPEPPPPEPPPEPVSKPPPSPKPVKRTPRPKVRPPARPSLRPAVLAIAGTLAAAVLGFAIAHSGGGGRTSSPDRQATAGALGLTYPSSWRLQTGSSNASLGLTDQIALASDATGGGTLIVGRSATSGSFLPTSFVSGLGAAPIPQIVTIGRLTFYRYVNLPAVGDGGSVYALPSTAGTIVGVCAGGAAAPRCESVLATVRLTSGSVLPLRNNAAYAQGLDTVITRLNAIRGTAGSQLQSARDAPSQATAANQLAAAHAAAAAALLHLSAGAASGANTALASAFRQTSTAYGALARAASRNDAQAYRDATSALKQATTNSDSAFSELGKLGYVVG